MNGSIVSWLLGLGSLVLVAALMLARWYAAADVKNLKRTLAWLGIGLLALVAAFLAITGRMGAALAALAGLAAWAGRKTYKVKGPDGTHVMKPLFATDGKTGLLTFNGLVEREFGAPWVKVSVTKLAPLKNIKRLGVTIERGTKS